MSTPANPDTTDLGVTGKIFHAPPQGRLVRNLDDAGEIYLLALEIAAGSARRASLLSIEEMRAIAIFAANAAEVLGQAIALVESSDACAPQEELRDRLHSLCTVTRQLTRKENA